MCSVHPLQERSIKLLRELYHERNYPLTRAINAVVNNFYPSLEEIVYTLNAYSEDDLVKCFVEENSEIISDANKNIVEINKIDSESWRSDSNSFLVDRSERTYENDPFEIIKAVSLRKIEKAISFQLSLTCQNSLMVEIRSVKSKINDLGDSVVNLNLVIKSRGDELVEDDPGF